MSGPVLPPVKTPSNVEKAFNLLKDPDSLEAREWFRFKVWAMAMKNEEAIAKIAAVEDEMARIKAMARKRAAQKRSGATT